MRPSTRAAIKDAVATFKKCVKKNTDEIERQKEELQDAAFYLEDEARLKEAIGEEAFNESVDFMRETGEKLDSLNG